MIRFLPFGLLILSIYCMMLRQSYVEPKYDVLPCNRLYANDDCIFMQEDAKLIKKDTLRPS